jgi:hypothetical protein
MTREEAASALEFAPCICDDEAVDPACRHHQALALARHALRNLGRLMETVRDALPVHPDGCLPCGKPKTDALRRALAAAKETP